MDIYPEQSGIFPEFQSPSSPLRVIEEHHGFTDRTQNEMPEALGSKVYLAV